MGPGGSTSVSEAELWEGCEAYGGLGHEGLHADPNSRERRLAVDRLIQKELPIQTEKILTPAAPAQHPKKTPQPPTTADRRQAPAPSRGDSYGGRWLR